MLPISVPWIMVAITSIANLLGSLMICIDVIWNEFSDRKFSILESDTFLGLSLSLSAGTMLITSINALLPRSMEYIKSGSPQLSDRSNGQIGAMAFFIGIVVCYFVNFLVVTYSSRSIAGCSHAGHGHGKSPVQYDPERAPLLQDNAVDLNSVRSGLSVHSCGDEELCHSNSVIDQRSNLGQLSVADSAKNSRELLAIGLQTTLGISIHRLPEGLLLFVTTQADLNLGISIVLALTLHSFSEGFSISAPLYSALKSRSKVIAIAMILGCGPQICGAFVGSLLFRSSEDLNQASLFKFGICMATTSGFMLVVSLQMVSSALMYKSQNFVIRWILFGCLVSLFSRLI